MDTITLDLETFWSKTHSLSKMLPMVYCMHPETEIISCSVKLNDGPTQVYFGEVAVKEALDALPVSSSLVVGHNMSGFDSMILAWRLGLKPRLWACTLAMARPIHTKTTGNSLAKLVAHYKLGVKDNSALVATQGKHLAEFTVSELEAMRRYNKADTDQCYTLFKLLREHYTAKELWHIDATIRMLVEPRFQVNAPLLETALSVERDQKRKAILTLARHLKRTGLASEAVSNAENLVELEEAVRSELASAPKFGKLLESLNVPVPMKPSPTDPTREVPALAKTDEAFTILQEHDNEIVSAAARARLAVKSTILETRIQAFLDTAAVTEGQLPVPLNYCGADTTGRWSGWAYNPQNLPRINPKSHKVSDALRNCMKAPPGHKVVVSDLSGIELRVNHYLWKVNESMDLYARDAEADLYKAFAAARYKVPVAEVTKDQRQLAKVAQLGLGFGAGWRTFQKVAKIMGGLELSADEAEAVTAAWRTQYNEIVSGWRTCHDALPHIYSGVEQAIDPWGMCITCKEGVRLPSGRVIRYPELHKEFDANGKDEWWYGTGRHRARIYAGKIDENLVQALARDIIADNALQFFQATKMRPALMVHDELVYIVPDADAEAALNALQEIMRTPPKWWKDLVTWSEGDIANTYGAAK